jgi:hypothetical protein
MAKETAEKKYTSDWFKRNLPRRHSRGNIAIPELRIECGYAWLFAAFAVRARRRAGRLLRNDQQSGRLCPCARFPRHLCV